MTSLLTDAPGAGRPLKLLVDQNLSWRLVRRLADLFPDSAHVRDFGLERAPDDPVWDRAAAGGFLLAAKPRL